MADFFPKREAELLEWLKNFSTVLTANAEAWNIPTVSAEETAALISAYAAALRKSYR